MLKKKKYDVLLNRHLEAYQEQKNLVHLNLLSNENNTNLIIEKSLMSLKDDLIFLIF